MRTSIFLSLSGLLSVSAFAQTPAISTETLKEVTRTLSADEFEGRAPGTASEDKTIGYIAGPGPKYNPMGQLTLSNYR